jgi:uncharacterized protein (TIGR00255 family)
MTGFGSASDDNTRWRVSIDARAVNHRALDVVVRLREGFRHLESDVRELAKGKLHRGRVELTVTVEAVGEGTSSARIDRSLLRAVVREIDALRSEGEPVDVPGAGDLLRLPGMLKVESSGLDWQAEDLDLVREVAGGALEGLVEARRQEGEKLRVEMREGARRLREAHDLLEARRSEVVRHYRERLKGRIEALLEEPALDPGRLEQEVAYLVEKSDVGEELDRLDVHAQHFLEALDAGSPAGKKLDFLLQEIQRELSTIGAKCRDLDMASQVVEARLASEQLREQVQNVE